MKHQDIKFKTRKTQATKTTAQNNSKTGKELDKINPEDLPEYIWLFIHLFNKNKFEKLLEWHKWDHKMNLTEDASRELNAKSYAMTIKKEEVLNQWLDEQLKAGLIMESKLRCTALYFYISKKDGLLRLVQDYRKLNQVTINDKILLPLIREVIDKLKEANTSTNSISSGDTTMFKFKKVTNRK